MQVRPAVSVAFLRGQQGVLEASFGKERAIDGGHCVVTVPYSCHGVRVDIVESAPDRGQRYVDRVRRCVHHYEYVVVDASLFKQVDCIAHLVRMEKKVLDLEIYPDPGCLGGWRVMP